ncbi:uncharacterized protein V1518DRAFT_205090 [Limtongia smithiae]|uniref:uncharacterized protein n=1 Tax=Limtongia smithiae TaxID=1125753 RepID=UPI0034CDD324
MVTLTTARWCSALIQRPDICPVYLPEHTIYWVLKPTFGLSNQFFSVPIVYCLAYLWIRSDHLINTVGHSSESLYGGSSVVFTGQLFHGSYARLGFFIVSFYSLRDIWARYCRSDSLLMKLRRHLRVEAVRTWHLGVRDLKLSNNEDHGDNATAAQQSAALARSRRLSRYCGDYID